MFNSHPTSQLKIGCPQCEQKLDVSHLAPFAEIYCPNCQCLIVVPCRFGHYLLEEPIEERSICSVYRAVDLKLDRPVAVKVFSPEITRHHDTMDRLISQTKRMAVLNHPNLIPIFSNGEYEDRYYIAMEYMSEHSLYNKLKSEYPLSVRISLDYITQAARGVAAAHREGMVHGDLNPRNILLGSDGNVKVSDFGMGRIGLNEEDKGGGKLPRLDKRYASPEIVRTGEGGCRSDIFSLGACLYFALTGHPPFSENRTAVDDEKMDVADLLIAGEPIEERPDIDEELNQFILQMLSSVPEERPNSCDDVIAHLEKNLRKIPERTRDGSRVLSFFRTGGRGKNALDSAKRLAGNSAHRKYYALKRQRRWLQVVLSAVVIALGASIFLLLQDRHREDSLYQKRLVPLVERIKRGLGVDDAINSDGAERSNEKAAGMLGDDSEEKAEQNFQVPFDEEQQAVKEETKKPEQGDDLAEHSWFTENGEPLEEEPEAATQNEARDRTQAGPDFARRPRPDDLNFSALQNELQEYLARHPEELREIEKERVLKLSRLRGYLQSLMRTPYDGSEDGILLADGSRIYGVIPFSNENEVSVRTANRRQSIRTVDWGELAIEQFLEFFRFYAEQRLVMKDAPQNEMLNIEPEQNAARDYFLTALLADWYGFYDQARKYSRRSVELDPGMRSQIRKFLYYLNDLQGKT